MSQKFVPGDVIKFDYTDSKGLQTKERMVAVEKIEDLDYGTLVAGNDLSLSDDDGQENYRQFYLSRMKNINQVDPNYNVKKEEAVTSVNKVGVSKKSNDLINSLLKSFGYPVRPDDIKGSLLWDLDLVKRNLENLPAGSPLVEMAIDSSIEILSQTIDSLEQVL